MAQAMSEYYNTQYLTGKNSVGERIRAFHDLQDDNADLEILFTVDILNDVLIPRLIQRNDRGSAIKAA